MILLLRPFPQLMNRMEHGVSMIYGNLNWSELLHLLSELSIKKEPGNFTGEQKKDKWIGRKPASKVCNYSN